MNAGPTLTPGTVLDGEYRIERQIGDGGMGAVYLAEQVSTGRRRALKVMHPQLVPDAKSRLRFQEEARIGARIPSEHVVEVVGAGVDEATGLPYLAMELLEGEDLSHTIEREGALPLSVVKELMLQTGHALAEAHRLGVVHRDLKPENLFIARSRRRGAELMVKVLDFGIAKTMQESRDAVTATSAIGSPLFMAPEQSSPGMQLRAATDVWALGLIAFHALTGKHYWMAANLDGAGLQPLLAEILVHPLEPASERARRVGSAGTLPAGFDAWFAACVVREPERRFPDAGACVASLERVLDGHGQAGLAVTMAAPSAFAGMGAGGVSGAGSGGSGASVTGPTTGWAGASTPGPSTGPSGSSGGTPAPGSDPGAAWRGEHQPTPHPAAWGAPMPAPQPAPARRSSGLPGVVLVGVAVAFVFLVGATMLAGVLITSAQRDTTEDVATGGPEGSTVTVSSTTGPAAPATGPSGLLTLNASEPATVLLDGQTLGQTPILQQRVAAGEHQVVFVTADGRRATRVVSVAVGSITMISESIAPATPPPAPTPAAPEGDEGTGTLMLNTSPFSQVSIDGREVGATPLRTSLPAGRHSLLLTTADGGRMVREVDITAGQQTRLALRFPGDDAPMDPPPAPAPNLPNTPSRGAIVTAMRSVQPAVRECADGTRGLIPVRVVWSSDGRVESATAGGAAPAPVRACVERAVREARVAPFRQAQMTVNYPFRL